MPTILKTTNPNELLQTNVLQQNNAQIPYGNLTYANFAYYWKHRFRTLIDTIFQSTTRLTIPIGFEPFFDYFSGFDFILHPFSNSVATSLHGFWERKMISGRDTITIYYADNCIPERQRFNIAHELIHIYQRIDPNFRSDFERLPIDLNAKEKLKERIAENAAAYYLAPLPIVHGEALMNPDPIYLADLFKISVPAMKICLTDYGIIKK